MCKMLIPMAEELESEVQIGNTMDKESSTLTPQEWKTATDYAQKLGERMMQSARDDQDAKTVLESLEVSASIDEPRY